MCPPLHDYSNDKDSISVIVLDESELAWRCRSSSLSREKTQPAREFSFWISQRAQWYFCIIWCLRGKWEIITKPGKEVSTATEPEFPSCPSLSFSFPPSLGVMCKCAVSSFGDLHSVMSLGDQYCICRTYKVYLTWPASDKTDEP